MKPSDIQESEDADFRFELQGGKMSKRTAEEDLLIVRSILTRKHQELLELRKRFIQLDNWRILHEQECEKARLKVDANNE